jgi:hypothetical protein
LRQPIPARVYLDGLEPDEIRRVVKIALGVVYELGRGNDWGAVEQIQFANLPVEEKVALWSCFSSTQRAILGSLLEVSRDIR